MLTTPVHTSKQVDCFVSKEQKHEICCKLVCGVSNSPNDISTKTHRLSYCTIVCRLSAFLLPKYRCIAWLCSYSPMVTWGTTFRLATCQTHSNVTLALLVSHQRDKVVGFTPECILWGDKSSREDYTASVTDKTHLHLHTLSSILINHTSGHCHR